MQIPQDPVGWIVPELGEDPVRAMVAAFYRRIPTDDVLGPMYPAEDLDGAEERLRDFLIERFGGAARYSEERGHPRLRMRHASFRIDQRARDRWMELMGEAMAETAWTERARAAIREFLDEVATFLVNR